LFSFKTAQQKAKRKNKMSKFFPKLSEEDLNTDAPDERPDERRTVDDSKNSPKPKKKVTKLWTDEDGNTYSKSQDVVEPDADYSDDLKARELAMKRSMPFKYDNTEERREILIEPEDLTIQEKIRKTALRDIRSQMQNEAIADPVRHERPYEDKFNMTGLHETERKFDSLGIRDGAEGAESRPRPTPMISAHVKTESVHIPEEKTTNAMKAAFRNLMGNPGEKTKSDAHVSKKAEVDNVVRAVLETGVSKPWTPPETMRHLKPDAVAHSVGKRALESIHAFKTIPELKNLSNREKDDLMVSIGRTMLNVAISGPTAAKPNEKITENASLSNDSAKRKILASIHPEIMKRALGPELLQVSLRDNRVSNTVRAPEGQSKQKVTPETVLNVVNKESTVSRTIAGTMSSLGSALRATPHEGKAEIPIRMRGVWQDPHLD